MCTMYRHSMTQLESGGWLVSIPMSPTIVMFAHYDITAPLQAPEIGSISPIRSTTASTIFAKGSPRSDCLNKTYARAMDQRSCAFLKYIYIIIGLVTVAPLIPTSGSSGLNMTPFLIRGPTQCSSTSVRAPSNTLWSLISHFG
jgi:hypothetical protein